MKSKEYIDLTCFAAEPKYASRFSKPDEKENKFRTKFARDRDRILYSKGFRRLDGKTQVFVSGYDDHIRNRLTHTLEVAQIAKAISGYIHINTDLAEAIAYGHDIGHTPFGHAGEKALNHIMNGCYRIHDFNIELKNDDKGFKHNLQSMRVLIDLENSHKDYRGLNLTDYTLWGIKNHTKTDYEKTCTLSIGSKCGLTHQKYTNCNNSGHHSVGFYDNYLKSVDDFSFTIEAIVVEYADEIAQRHHDVEDAIIAKLIKPEVLLDRFNEIFGDKYINIYEKETFEKLKQYSFDNEVGQFTTRFSSFLINFYVRTFSRMLITSLKRIKNTYSISSHNDFMKKKVEIYNNEKMKIINIKEGTNDAVFKEFLKKSILNSYVAQSMDGKSSYIIRRLFKAYTANPQQLPDGTIKYLFYNFYSKIGKPTEEINNVFKQDVGSLRNILEKDHYTNDTYSYKVSVLRTICDFISGMTDDFAYKQYDLLYGTSKFNK